MNTPSSGAGVQSVEAALRVLEALGQGIGPVRISELADKLQLTRPRVCRHLATLEEMGFARKIGRQGYTFGTRLTQMAHQVVRERTFSELAQPTLEALRDEVGQTVTLSAPTREGAVVLICIESGQATSIRVKQGTILRYPHSPAARLAAAYSPAQLQATLAQRGEAAAELARQRMKDQGVDFEIDTQGTGLGGIAAPVVVDGRLLGVVSLVLSSRQLMPAPSARVISAIRRAVNTLEKEAAS